MTGTPTDSGAPPDRRPVLGRAGSVALATLAVTLPLAWSAANSTTGRAEAEASVVQHRADVLARCISEAARQLCIAQAALPTGEPISTVGPDLGAPAGPIRDEKVPPRFLVPELIDLPPPAA